MDEEAKQTERFVIEEEVCLREDAKVSVCVVQDAEPLLEFGGGREGLDLHTEFGKDADDKVLGATIGCRGSAGLHFQGYQSR